MPPKIPSPNNYYYWLMFLVFLLISCKPYNISYHCKILVKADLMDAFYVILESVLLILLPFNLTNMAIRDSVILFNTDTLDNTYILIAIESTCLLEVNNCQTILSF